jgi:cytosine/adenosine deaminase-related metal-dependent hydrolase
MIIASKKILTMHHDTPSFDNGAVVFSRGTILDVGPADNIIKKYRNHRIYLLRNTVLLPGLVNVHTHLELPSLLETIRTKKFSDWVINLIKAKERLSSLDYVSATARNIQTLIHTGTTAVAEICTHNISPALLRQRGLRSIVFYEIISMSPSSPFPHLPLKVSVHPFSLVQTGISPHAPHTVSETALLRIKKIALQKKLRLSMHVAESKDEIKLLQGKRSGFERLYQLARWDPTWAPSAESPVEFLHKLGILSANFLAVHAVQVTDRDIGIIKRSRVAVAHCPRSNRETHVGKMPLKKFLDSGVTVGLGTDSLASSPSLNLWDEMRYAYRIHRSTGVTARDIVTLATAGGAKALGLFNAIGSIEPGKRADIIAVPIPKKDTGDIYSDLLRETKYCNMSVVGGKILYRK